MQLASLEGPVLSQLTSVRFPPPWDTDAELERVANDWLMRLRDERGLAARKRGPVARLRDAIDRVVRTTTTEHMDRDDVDDSYKIRAVASLDRLNRMQLSYRRFAGVLAPFMAPGGRPTRVLELASGSGDFTFELFAAMSRQGLNVRVTGSDIVPAYVDRARSEAARRGVAVDFRVLDAFSFDGVEAGAFDVVFMAQAAHHFTPGQLARIIASGLRVAKTVVIIDGVRALWLLGYLAVVTTPFAVLAGDRRFLADALISGRKFYSRAELELIGRIAGRSATVRVEAVAPGYSLLTASNIP
jgi:SAM-dependent methyltransferase